MQNYYEDDRKNTDAQKMLNGDASLPKGDNNTEQCQQ